MRCMCQGEGTEVTNLELSRIVVDRILVTVRPRLSSRAYLVAAGSVTKDKGGGHTAHRIDDDAEVALVDALGSEEFDGSLFSEEAHLVKFGESNEFLVSDPYCNTTLTFSGVRESACTAYHLDSHNRLLDGCIGDMQIDRRLYFDGRSVRVLWSDGSITEAQTSAISEVEDARAVISLLKRSRREYLDLPLARSVGNLLTVDGGIVALRLAVGDLDVFVDHRFGQPSYEALAYWLVEAAGGTVTDGEGEPIVWTDLVGELREGTVRRQTIVAAANATLHASVLALL